MKAQKKSRKKVVRKTGGRTAQTVTLKKVAPEGGLPPQAAAILAVLKAKGGKLTVADLTAAMESTVKTEQPMARIWSFYRARLTKAGFVSLE